MSWLYLPVECENYPYSQEQEEDCLQQPGSLDLQPSAMLSGKPIASKSSSNVSPTDTCTTPPSGTTCKPSTGTPGVDAWISSLRGFRANRLAELASKRERMISAICGPTQLELFGNANPLPFSSKTFPVLSVLDTSLPFSTTYLKQATRAFPQFGLQLVTLVPTIKGSASGLWRTPNSTVIDAKTSVVKLTGRTPGDPQVGLADQVMAAERQMFPTPVDPSKGGGSSRSGDRIHEIPTLQGMARRGLWPTPQAQMPGAGANNSKVQNLLTGNRHSFYLTQAVEAERQKPGIITGQPRPTPQLPEVIGGQLNPPWVEWLMGWPIGWTDLKPLETDKCPSAQQSPFAYWLETMTAAFEEILNGIR